VADGGSCILVRRAMKRLPSALQRAWRVARVYASPRTAARGSSAVEVSVRRSS
jgi:hypothetical protein